MLKAQIVILSSLLNNQHFSIFSQIYSLLLLNWTCFKIWADFVGNKPIICLLDGRITPLANIFEWLWWTIIEANLTLSPRIFPIAFFLNILLDVFLLTEEAYIFIKEQWLLLFDILQHFNGHLNVFCSEIETVWLLFKLAPFFNEIELIEEQLGINSHEVQNVVNHF